MMVDSMRAEVIAAGRHGLADSNDTNFDPQLARLRHLADSVIPVAPIPHAGWRGKAAFLVKMGIRRIIYWYVEPSWLTQQQIDRELLATATAAATTVAQLQTEIDRINRDLDRVKSWNLRLQRESAVLRSRPSPREANH